MILKEEMGSQQPSCVMRSLDKNFFSKHNHPKVLQLKNKLCQAAARRRVALRLNPGNQSIRPGHTLDDINSNDVEFATILPQVFYEEYDNMFGIIRIRSGRFWIRLTGNDKNPTVPDFGDALPVFVKNTHSGLKTKSRIRKKSQSENGSGKFKSLAFEDVVDFIPDNKKVVIKSGKDLPRCPSDNNWIRTYFELNKVPDGKTKAVLS